ncbi:M20/M25/M40 family metallo-hydrolase [Aurantiacibacter poecillastricola]|uniref:M20/M25/M40 family metallo-hydrolase n=1 Tax=Aurantiacibacter poecillastricola TaxID=3064385 RepID=UPI00273D45A9|nr:M20/M25/M40 family metallo-hydrolase [Aurantiacibacter sp. 219JJ12-13]MDP5261829.1 M20/M25/M40 family metallo-hydrolase [Aurantiacibacter sp. 219JJ12-13]
MTIPLSRFAATILTGATALGLAAPAAAQLSPAEQTMMSTVEAGFEDDVALLEAITNVNSGTHNHQGVREVGQMLIPAFEGLGFEVEWIDQDHVGRAGHLFATHEAGNDSTRMLLIGHIDTVFEPDSPFQQFVRDGDVATGPGVVDDKGGIVVILSALRAMEAAATLDGANIIVALTGDEEDVGDPIEEARADLIEAGRWADVALGFEGLSVMDGQDMGVVARRSSNSWTLTTTGRTGHSSGIFSEGAGYGAIYEMARILDAFREELPEENLTYNVGFLAGGTPATLGEDELSASTIGKTNIIPDSAVARGDLRTLTQEQTDRAVAAMQAIVDANLPGTDAELEFEFRYPPMAPTEGNSALLARLNAINADMGLGEMGIFPPARRGAADISFVAPYADGLAGMGPDGSGSHAVGESADLRSFTRQAQRAAILMSRLAGEEPARD